MCPGRRVGTAGRPGGSVPGLRLGARGPGLGGPSCLLPGGGAGQGACGGRARREAPAQVRAPLRRSLCCRRDGQARCCQKCMQDLRTVSLKIFNSKWKHSKQGLLEQNAQTKAGIAQLSSSLQTGIAELEASCLHWRPRDTYCSHNQRHELQRDFPPFLQIPIAVAFYLMPDSGWVGHQ